MGIKGSTRKQPNADALKPSSLSVLPPLSETQNKTLMSSEDHMLSEKVQNPLSKYRGKRSRKIPLFLTHKTTWQSCGSPELQQSPPLSVTIQVLGDVPYTHQSPAKTLTLNSI